jgi:hypothetical protein
MDSFITDPLRRIYGVLARCDSTATWHPGLGLLPLPGGVHYNRKPNAEARVIGIKQNAALFPGLVVRCDSDSEPLMPGAPY